MKNIIIWIIALILLAVPVLAVNDYSDAGLVGYYQGLDGDYADTSNNLSVLATGNTTFNTTVPLGSVLAIVMFKLWSNSQQ